MKFYVLASLILFCLVIRHATRRSARKTRAEEEDFWARESRANGVRRRSLDDLPYITIPLESLPMDTLTENETVRSCIQTIEELAGIPIVNLTGYTNTDLKLEYGAPNITLLSQYDQSYTLLVSTLQKWAELLWKEGYRKEAADICEFAVSTETDVSRTYYLLADYLSAEGRREEIRGLLETTDRLRSHNKNQIAARLKEYLS